MSEEHGNHGAPTHKIEPLRGVERVEWARLALEEAVARMVKFPNERVYAIAVMSRWRELDEIRAAAGIPAPKMEAPKRPIVITAAMAGAPLPVPNIADMVSPFLTTLKHRGRPRTQPRCPSCDQVVIVQNQHHTGERYMCEKAGQSPGDGR